MKKAIQLAAAQKRYNAACKEIDTRQAAYYRAVDEEVEASAALARAKAAAGEFEAPFGMAVESKRGGTPVAKICSWFWLELPFGGRGEFVQRTMESHKLEPALRELRDALNRICK